MRRKIKNYIKSEDLEFVNLIKTNGKKRTIFFNAEKREKLSKLKQNIFKLNSIFNEIKIKNLRFRYSNLFFHSKTIGYIYYLKYHKNEITYFHYNNFDFFFVLISLIKKEKIFNMILNAINSLLVNF